MALSARLPEVTSAYPFEHIPTHGGTKLTLQCNHIGVEAVPITVAIDGRNCAVATWVDSSTITCTAPPWSGTDLSIAVTVGGRTSVGGPTLSYAPFEVTGVVVPLEVCGVGGCHGPAIVSRLQHCSGFRAERCH